MADISSLQGWDRGGASMFEKMIEELKTKILEAIARYLKSRDTVKPRLTGLISAQEVMDELDVKYKTLQKWEDAGLRRYQPPLEDTRKIYYRISDLLKFLGVENG